MCILGIHCQVAINALINSSLTFCQRLEKYFCSTSWLIVRLIDWLLTHSIKILIDTQSTVDWQLVNSWQSIDWQSIPNNISAKISQLLTDWQPKCWSSANLGVCQLSIKCWLRIDQGYWLTCDCAFLWYSWSCFAWDFYFLRKFKLAEI